MAREFYVHHEICGAAGGGKCALACRTPVHGALVRPGLQVDFGFEIGFSHGWLHDDYWHLVNNLIKSLRNQLTVIERPGGSFEVEAGHQDAALVKLREGRELVEAAFVGLVHNDLISEAVFVSQPVDRHGVAGSVRLQDGC